MTCDVLELKTKQKKKLPYKQIKFTIDLKHENAKMPTKWSQGRLLMVVKTSNNIHQECEWELGSLFCKNMYTSKNV